MSPDSTLDRHWTVSVYVVSGGRVALHQHQKLGLWLPAGGHVEPGETPDDAARREALEETGLVVVLDTSPPSPISAAERGSLTLSTLERVGQPEADRGEVRRPGEVGVPIPLARPIGVQLATVGPNHEHIDLIYVASPANGALAPALADGFHWLTAEEAEGRGAPPDVVGWARLIAGN